MGLTIRTQRIKQDASVFGQIYFVDTDVELFDANLGENRKVHIDGGTILVDPRNFLLRNLGSVNNTTIHECVHWDKHRKVFELEKLFNADASCISCEVVGGAIPYGYRSIDHRLQIDDYEAEIVRKVFELYRQEGSTATSVADELNKSSYECRDKNGATKPFTYEFVKRVIDNPFYCGRLYFNRRTNKKDHNGKIIKCDPKNIIEVQGNHEPIVSEELWEETHAKRVLIAERYKKSAENVYTHILTGIVRCPVCGSNLSGMVNRYKKRNSDEYSDKFYYRCLHRKRLDNGEKCNFNHSYRQEQLNEEVERIVLDMVRDRKFCDFITKKLEDKIDVSNLEAERSNLREQLRQVEGAKRKLTEQMDKLDVTDRNYNRKYQDMQDRLDNLYDRINELEDAIA